MKQIIFIFLLTTLFQVTSTKLFFKKFLASSILGINTMITPYNFPNIDSNPLLVNQVTYVSKKGNDIYLYGDINQDSSKLLKDYINEANDQIDKIKEYHPVSPINIHIQSNGGSFLHSLYIIDLIKNSPNEIDTYIDGFAASAATLVSLAGEKRYMTKNSLMLIHELSGGSEGKYNQIKDNMRNFDLFMNMIKNMYKENSKLTENDLNYLLSHDFWLSSKECLEYGLIDKIIE